MASSLRKHFLQISLVHVLVQIANIKGFGVLVWLERRGSDGSCSSIGRQRRPRTSSCGSGGCGSRGLRGHRDHGRALLRLGGKLIHYFKNEKKGNVYTSSNTTGTKETDRENEEIERKNWTWRDGLLAFLGLLLPCWAAS